MSTVLLLLTLEDLIEKYHKSFIYSAEYKQLKSFEKYIYNNGIDLEDI